jgi:hypothetical protein
VHVVDADRTGVVGDEIAIRLREEKAGGDCPKFISMCSREVGLSDKAITPEQSPEYYSIGREPQFKEERAKTTNRKRRGHGKLLQMVIPSKNPWNNLSNEHHVIAYVEAELLRSLAANIPSAQRSGSLPAPRFPTRSIPKH